MRKSRNVVVALTMLATGSVIGVAAQHSASADVSSGDRPVLIQITPCRLADTRPAPNNVGPRLGKIGPAETVDVDVQDASTDCAGAIPTDAVGISTNITALGATELSFLTIWPSGAQPLAASLNPAPGEPPTPNAVTTAIDDGMFKIFNASGSTDVVIDVNGYYVNHTHDDLYGGDPVSTTAGTFSVGAASFDAWESQFGWQKNLELGASAGGAWITSNPHGGVIPALAAPLHLPDGATITSATAYFSDETPTGSLNFQIRCEAFTGGTTIVAQGDSVASPASGADAMDITTTNATVDNSACSYFFIAESGGWAGEGSDLKVRGVSVTTE